jgi:hypothetical protein
MERLSGSWHSGTGRVRCAGPAAPAPARVSEPAKAAAGWPASTPGPRNRGLTRCARSHSALASQYETSWPRTRPGTAHRPGTSAALTRRTRGARSNRAVTGSHVTAHRQREHGWIPRRRHQRRQRDTHRQHDPRLQPALPQPVHSGRQRAPPRCAAVSAHDPPVLDVRLVPRRRNRGPGNRRHGRLGH